MLVKCLSKLVYQVSIFSVMRADRTLAPGIKPAFRDSEHVTHHRNSKLLLVSFNKPIFHLDSREKMLTAFLIYPAPVVIARLPISGGDFPLPVPFDALCLETLLA